MRTRRSVPAVLLPVVLSLFSCSKIDRGSPAEIQSLIRGGNAANVVVVDVRPAVKYGEGHIASAINIPIESDTFERRIAALDRGREIGFYCGTGQKTDKAAETAERLGFGKIHVLEGGIEAWEKAGLELTR